MKKIFLLLTILLNMTLLICSCVQTKETEIIFDMGNGEEKSFKVEEFDELTVPEDPKREGYKFEGWYFDGGYQSPFTTTELFNKEKGGTIKIYSKWTAYSALEFKYEFYLDGGNIGDETVVGMNAPTRENPKKANFVFEGWYFDDSFTKAFGVDKITPEMAEETTKLYAKMKPFAECEFNLQFTVDGAVYSKVLTTGTSFTYPAAPEKDGYSFVGWYLDENFEKEFNASTLADFPVDAPVIIYAKFTEAVADTGYKVSFYVDGALYNTAYTENGKITLPKAPAKEHMTFRGWYYDMAFRYEFDESECIDANKSLYALFVNKEIIATLKNGESITSTKISYSSDYKLQSFSTDKTNKKAFLGWKIEGTDTLITDNKGNSLSHSTFDNDVTLVAVWESYTYILSLCNNGDTEYHYLKSDRLDFTVPNLTFDKWYYVFDGWYTDSNEKIDVNNHVFTEDLKLTAKFVLTDEVIPLVLDTKAQFQFTFADGFPKNGETYKEVYNFIGNVLDKYFFGSARPAVYTERYDDSPLISGYEILIGSDARFRGEECNISSTALGETGYVIKIVGNIIVIAGGSDAATKEAFLKFAEDFVTLAIDFEYPHKHIVVKNDIYYEQKHDFPVKSVTIGGTDISEFTICTDYDWGYGDIAENFRDLICDTSGYYPEICLSAGQCLCEHHIFISDKKYEYNYEKDENGDGFVIYVEDGKMVIACIYPMLFEETLNEFAEKYITGKTGSISFDNGFVYTKNVSVVTYEDFGAVGDGVTDDFEALYNTHIHANANGQKVLGKAGATYYIGDTFTKSIPVKTSVDFCGATIIINDKGNVAFEYLSLDLFAISGETYKIMASELESGIELYVGDTSLPWLRPFLSNGNAMVRVVNTSNIMYSQYVGANTSNVGGIVQSETFIVDCYGNILNGDSVRYKFDKISYVEICLDYGLDEQVIENGIFKTQRAVKTEVSSGYYGTERYRRGISIGYKSNITLKNITHEVLGEPVYNQNKDLAFDYRGFISMSFCYGVKVIDTTLYAQRQYLGYDNRNPSRFPITPYDLIISSCADVTIDGLTLFNDRGITDTGCNDVLQIVSTRNLVIKNSRINAVEFIGLLGGTVEKTTIGRVIELVGGGDLVFDEVVRIANKSFLELTDKYGAYFNGNITFKNCEMKGEKAYNSNAGETGSTGTFANLFLITSMFKAGDTDYVNHQKFAGAFTMPYTVTIEGGFKVNSGAKAYVFADISDAAFDPDYSYNGEIAYIATDSVTFKGVSRLALTNGTSERLNSIFVFVEQ